MTDEYCSKCGGKLAKDTGFCANCASPDTKLSYNAETKKISTDDDATANAVINAVGGIVAGTNNATTSGIGRVTGAVGDTDRISGIGTGTRYSAATGATGTIGTTGTEGHNTAGVGSRSAAGARSAPPEKPKGLFAKFKALPRPAKIAIVCCMIILCILIIAGITALVNHALNLAPIPDRPVVEDPVDAIPDGVQSVRIMHDGAVFSDGEIQIGDSIFLRAVVEPEDIDEEVIWTNHNPSVIEVTYNNAKRTDITVTGVGRGLVRLTALVGGVEAVSVFRVLEGPPPDAESVVITLDGTPVDRAEIYAGDSAVLRILVEPEGAVDEIIFSSSNPGILDAAASNYNLDEIVVTGVSDGSATLTVSVGDISVECTFEVIIRYVEVPHPYAVALQEFFRGAYVFTAAYIADVPDAEEPVVLAVRFVNENEPTYRVMYMRDGNLRTHDFIDIFWPISRVSFSDNNHLVTVFSDEGIWFDVHLFERGDLRVDTVKLWTIFDPELFDGFWHNDRRVTEAEFDALLRLYGLRSDNIWVDRADNTAQILAMTIMAPAT